MTASSSLSTVEAAHLPAAATPARWRAIDAVRGLVMVVMALDHLRDYLGSAHFDATELAHTTLPIFVSRWITHFCAPAFFLLAGMSAYLSIRSGRRTVPAAARFLVVRGLALVVLEQTVLRCFGWYFHFDYHFMNAGVLYGLGLAMVMMGGLVRLPPAVSLGLGLAIVLGEPAIAGLPLARRRAARAGGVRALAARRPGPRRRCTRYAGGTRRAAGGDSHAPRTWLAAWSQVAWATWTRQRARRRWEVPTTRTRAGRSCWGLVNARGRRCGVPTSGSFHGRWLRGTGR